MERSNVSWVSGGTQRVAALAMGMALAAGLLAAVPARAGVNGGVNGSGAPAGLRSQGGISAAELAARVDLWPEKAALNKDVRLQGMAPIAKGTELRVLELNASMVTLATGEVLFDMPLQDTDVLERARAAIARMTPEQLALTEAVLRERSDLWPLEVALTAELGFTNGVVFEVGRMMRVRDLGPDGVWLCDRPTGEVFQAAIQETDLVKRARERMSLPEAEREPFFVRALEASIERDGAIGAPGALNGAELLLVYKGRKGCGRCASFVPELKRFYERVKPGHPGFEVLYVSQDATPELAREHRSEMQIPGLAIALERNLEAAHLASISGQLLPTVLLFDRKGALVAQNHPNAGTPTAEDVLAELEQRLADHP